MDNQEIASVFCFQHEADMNRAYDSIKPQFSGEFEARVSKGGAIYPYFLVCSYRDQDEILKLMAEAGVERNVLENPYYYGVLRDSRPYATPQRLNPEDILATSMSGQSRSPNPIISWLNKFLFRKTSKQPATFDGFVLDGCDLSPHLFRSYTSHNIDFSISTSLEEESSISYYAGGKKCLTKKPKDKTRGFFSMAFSLEDSLLQEIVLDAKYDSDFLGVKSGDPERILTQSGFRKFAKFKGRPDIWDIWKQSQFTNILAIVHRNPQGRLVEVYYYWRDKPYLKEDVERV